MKAFFKQAIAFFKQVIFRLSAVTPKFFRILRRLCLTVTGVCAALALMPLHEDTLKLVGIVGGAAGTCGAFIASLAVDWQYHQDVIIPAEQIAPAPASEEPLAS